MVILQSGNTTWIGEPPTHVGQPRRERAYATCAHTCVHVARLRGNVRKGVGGHPHTQCGVRLRYVLTPMEQKKTWLPR